jgi:hypothetical protein
LAAGQLEPYLGVIRKQEQRTDAGGTPMCSWKPTDGHMLNLALYVNDKSAGVADLYEKKSGDNFFEKAGPIAGYPAVHVSARPDGPQRGDCMLIVAVSDHASISVFPTTVTESNQYYRNTCAAADKLAEAAVGNLKAGG